MRSSWSQLLLAAASVVLAAIAGSLFSSGPVSAALLAALVVVVAAAMFCGAAAAVQAFRARVRSQADESSEDPTIELDAAALALRPAAPWPALRPLGAFVAASSVTIALIAATLAWTRDSNAIATQVDPPAVAAIDAEPTPVASPSAERAAPVSALPASVSAVRVRSAVRAADPSLARRECFAQIESAHLFLGLARQATGAGAYTRSSNSEIKRYQQARPIDPLTLQRIALRMWEQRNAPDRGPEWWSSQYARCEEARVAGSGYIVRG